jgi:hypothetical protein
VYLTTHIPSPYLANRIRAWSSPLTSLLHMLSPESECGTHLSYPYSICSDPNQRVVLTSHNPTPYVAIRNRAWSSPLTSLLHMYLPESERGAHHSHPYSICSHPYQSVELTTHIPTPYVVNNSERGAILSDVYPVSKYPSQGEELTSHIPTQYVATRIRALCSPLTTLLHM